MDQIKTLIGEVLEKGYLMSLGTVDNAGPWVADVNFAYDEAFAIYWLSTETVRHSKAIANNSSVAGTITLCNKETDVKTGIQFAGTAEKVTVVPLEVAERYAAKKGKPVPLDASELLRPGQSWYRLRPMKIDLVHQPLFGYEKKFLEL